MVLTRSSTKKDSAEQPEECRSSNRPIKRPRIEHTAASTQEDHVSIDSQAVHVLGSICRVGCCQVQSCCMLIGCLSACDRHHVAAAMAVGVRLYWTSMSTAGS